MGKIRKEQIWFTLYLFIFRTSHCRNDDRTLTIFVGREGFTHSLNEIRTANGVVPARFAGFTDTSLSGARCSASIGPGTTSLFIVRVDCCSALLYSFLWWRFWPLPAVRLGSNGRGSCHRIVFDVFFSWICVPREVCSSRCETDRFGHRLNGYTCFDLLRGRLQVERKVV